MKAAWESPDAPSWFRAATMAYFMGSSMLVQFMTKVGRNREDVGFWSCKLYHSQGDTLLRVQFHEVSIGV